MDDNYSVLEKQELDEDVVPKLLEDRNEVDDEEMQECWHSVYNGSLADCEAYIRLKEGGYM